MIKNIIFDMGGVLIKWNPEELMAKYNLTSEEYDFLLERIFYNWKWSLLDAGYYTNRQFVDVVAPTIPEYLRSVLYDVVMNYGREPVPAVPGMPGLVKKLKKNGYRIYLLSNAGLNHSEYWCNVEGHEFFDGVFVSAYYKMLKPERIIYKTMLDTFGIKAEESVFIDDLPINCAGAFLCGITPVNFKGTDKLIEELTELGVKI